MTAINITLPYPPSANRYWRHLRNGRTIVSDEARVYRTTANALCRITGMRPLDGRVCVTYHVYRPIKRGDLMNREKVLSDALQGAAFADDAQIHEAHLYLHDDKANPRVEVTVDSLD